MKLNEDRREENFLFLCEYTLNKSLNTDFFTTEELCKLNKEK